MSTLIAVCGLLLSVHANSFFPDMYSTLLVSTGILPGTKNPLFLPETNMCNRLGKK